MEITLIAKTEFLSDIASSVMSGFMTDARGGSALVEAAGRACYQSWSKPNPETKTNNGYISHILDVGHYSVLEHGAATFYITGVSRSFTHELVRHRHLSYSQLSQRYVNESNAKMIEPAIIASDSELHKIFQESVKASQNAYDSLVAGLKDRFSDVTSAAQRCKQARQAARSVLPNATETRIVVTGNYRAWRHFISMRASEFADVEIREVAIEILYQLQKVAPAVFSDFIVSTTLTGYKIATTSNVEAE